MPQSFDIQVNSPDALLNPGAYKAAAIIRVQSSATEAGVFADVSGSGSTPAITIVTDQTSYPAFDPLGVASTWYRTRYESLDATRLSEWETPHQIGADLLCTLNDVKQRLYPAASAGDPHPDDEMLLGFIRDASSDTMGYTGRRFAKSPSSGETTFYFDVPRGSRELHIPAGVASMSVLEVATSSQPATGGTFTTVPAADWFLRPMSGDRDFGWPATSVVISDLSGSAFYEGFHTVRATMALGWPAVPPEIKSMAERYVIKAYQGKGSGVAVALATGEFEGRLINFLSPEDLRRLDFYRSVPVGIG